MERWLIVRGNADVRVIKTRPAQRDLRKDEVAFKLVIEIPPAWAKVSAQEIRIKLPEVPAPSASAEGDPVIGERVEVIDQDAP